MLELVFAQGAGGPIFSSVCFELRDKGGDRSFHDGLCLELNKKGNRDTKN